MFYLETKDGERFFTNKDSDDVAEFKQILETKLGPDAATLFEEIINEKCDEALSTLNKAKFRLQETIREFDAVMEKTPSDKDKLDEVLSEFQELYLNFFM